MENPCRIVTLGDSITKEYTDVFRQRFVREYPEIQSEIINEGVVSDTSTHGVARLQTVVDHKPDVVIVGFGMNDWRKGISKETFRDNMRSIVDELKRHKARVILNTINPDWNGREKGTTLAIDEYNAIVRDVAHGKHIRIADINSLWKRELRSIQDGLRDEIHPNERGYAIIVEALMRVVPRSTTTVVWQYNGGYGACNYSCPYCYYPTKGHYFQGTIQAWHDGFKNTFGDQRLTFYLSYGEPMLGKAFHDVVEMIAAEPNWDMMMTTNLSRPLEQLIDTRLVREGRLNINASFHPSQKVTLESFLKQLFILRDHGIESPVVYVMYPQQMGAFEHYFRILDKNSFFVHVRRFKGKYRNETYPEAYTERERRFVARYMDNLSLKYMLADVNWHGKLSYAGMYYFVVGNNGDVGASAEHWDFEDRGNILRGDVRIDWEPLPFGGTAEGSVDGTAAILEVGLKELTDNHVWTFAQQGGVFRTDKGIHYPHLHTDFSDPKVREKYNFGSRASRIYFVLRRPWQVLPVFSRPRWTTAEERI